MTLLSSPAQGWSETFSDRSTEQQSIFGQSAKRF
jgi:hypothetical protein